MGKLIDADEVVRRLEALVRDKDSLANPHIIPMISAEAAIAVVRETVIEGETQ